MKNKTLICTLFVIFTVGSFGVSAQQDQKNQPDKVKPKVTVGDKDKKEEKKERDDKKRDDKDNKKPPSFFGGI